MKKSIIFAEFHPWESPIKVGGRYYAEQFAKDGWHVLWLSNFLNFNRIIRRDEYDRIYIRSWRSGVRQVDQNIYTYSPYALIPYIDVPILSSIPVAKNCLRWCIPSLKSLLEKCNFNPVDILWISQPRMYSLVNEIQHKILFYRMFDEVKHFRGEPSTISKVEEMLTNRANITFATSQSLVKKAQQLGGNAVYLPNGADIARFQDEINTCPRDYQQIPTPRILYLGAISEWFDYEVMYTAVKENPDWSFVFIGPWNVQTIQKKKEFELLTNFYYLGPKDPKETPAYVKYSDVGLIPFVRNELTHSVSPIKLFEYCSAGLPVVAAKLDEIEQYSSFVQFYNEPDELIRSIQLALKTDYKKKEELADFGAKNSWENRYHLVLEQLSRLDLV